MTKKPWGLHIVCHEAGKMTRYYQTPQDFYDDVPRIKQMAEGPGKWEFKLTFRDPELVLIATELNLPNVTVNQETEEVTCDA